MILLSMDLSRTIKSRNTKSFNDFNLEYSSGSRGRR